MGSSGSRPRKMYMRVFSMMASISGLSEAHFMAHTSFLSNLDSSLLLLLPISEISRASPGPGNELDEESKGDSRSRNVSTPVMSITDKRL